MARKIISPADHQRVLRKLDRVKAAPEPGIEEESTNAATRIVGRAKRLAPVINGEVRDSITWKKEQKGKRKQVVIGSELKDRGKTGLLIVEELEFGTKTRPAKPFLFPAFEQEKTEYRNAVRRRIRADFKKIGGSK